MGQRPNELTPERSPRHWWGAELRAVRTERGQSLAELGRRIHRDRSFLARVERGERAVTAELARDCDRALDTGGTLSRLFALIPDSPGRGNDGHVVNIRGDVASTGFDLAGQGPQSGAWETPDDEIAVPARTAEGQVIFVAVSRRHFLQGVGAAAAGAVAVPAAAAAVPEQVLAFSGQLNPVEHLDQVRRLLVDADNLFGPSRVIPTVQEKIALIGQLRGAAGGADRRGLLRAQARFAEFAGWLHQDSGDHRAAQHWLARALQWSQGSGDPELATYVLARQAQLAGDMSDGIDAVDLAEAAEAMAPAGSRLGVVAAVYGGHGHALRGDRDAVERAYDHARELLAGAEGPGRWAPWLDAAYIDVAEFRSRAVAGDHQGAAAGFQRALDALPAGFHRDRGVYLARAAAAHAGADDVEQAAALGMQALTIGIDTRSGRIMTELDGLHRQLGRTDAAAAADFRDAWRSTVTQQL